MTDFREYSAAFMDHQNDLAHYGVKGMRKGVRKDKENTSDYLKRKANNFMVRTENKARNTGDRLIDRANKGDWMTLAYHYKRNPTARALMNSEAKKTVRNAVAPKMRTDLKEQIQKKRKQKGGKK